MSNYYGYDYWNTDSLSHHGVKGQKWGVRRTPEELGHILANKTSRLAAKNDSNTAKIKKLMNGRSYEQLSDKEKAKVQTYMNRIAKNVNKSQKATEKYSKKITKSQEAIDKFKKELITKGSRQDILDNKELFTDNELNAIANRKSIEDRLKGPDTIEKITDTINKGTRFVDSGLNTYNSVKKIMGIFDEISEKNRAKDVENIIKSQDADIILEASKNMKSSEVEEAKKRLSNVESIKKFASKENVDDKSTDSSNKKDVSTKSSDESSKATSNEKTASTKSSDEKQNKPTIKYDNDEIGKRIINDHSAVSVSSATKTINEGTDKRYNYGGVFRRKKNDDGSVKIIMSDDYANTYLSDIMSFNNKTK